MRGRIILLILVILALGTSAVIWLNRRKAEPSYNGLPLSFWVEEHRTQTPVTEPMHEPRDRVATVRAAIITTGTNGLPFLISWARYEPSLPGSRFLSWAPLQWSHA